MSTIDELIQTIQGLPKRDQWRVWERLSEVLEPDTEDPAVVAEAWREEIERRSNEIDAGTAKLVSWEEVRAKARAHLGIPPDA
jgi:putative addiction module component (TIGR02574 family)